MYYCYSIKQGLFDGEMMYAKELGIYVFYDENKDLFFDKDGEVFEIKNKKIFPRTGVYQAKKLINAIKRHCGNLVVDELDYKKTLNWSNYIETQRNNIIMSGKEILDNQKKIMDIFGVDRLFFKTKNKNYSQIIAVEEFLESDTAFIKTLKDHEFEDFILSDVVDILEDESGPLEYRCFIINQEIFNISRVHDYLLCDIPSSVLDKLKSVIEELKGTDFPKSYVLDLFIGKKNNQVYVDVLECNPIVSSGTYLYNSIFSKSDDLLHKCPSKSLPIEKIKYGNISECGFNVTNKPIPSIRYKLPGGFAADLLSYTLLGTKSNNGQFIHLETEGNLNPLNIGINKKNVVSFSELVNRENVESNDEKLFKELRLRFLKKK